jgi:hypothetical protein
MRDSLPRHLPDPDAIPAVAWDHDPRKPHERYNRTSMPWWATLWWSIVGLFWLVSIVLMILGS